MLSAQHAIIPIYQHAAENRLIQFAQQIKEDLCINFDRAMCLAKELHPEWLMYSKWKE